MERDILKKTISARLTENQKETISVLSKESNVTKSEFVRLLVCDFLTAQETGTYFFVRKFMNPTNKRIHV